MTDNNVQRIGDIDMSGEMLQLLNNLCMNEEHSDVIIVIGNSRIPAHKFVLSMRSPYFERLLCGSFAEATQMEVVLKVPLEAFKLVLRFIYTGRIPLVTLNVDQIVDVCELAEQYDFESLKQAISTQLINILSMDNYVAIFDAAQLYTLENLRSKVMHFMDVRCSELLTHETFKTMSQSMVCTLLERDTFYAPEMKIFTAVRDWFEIHPEADAKMLFSRIRWPLMSSTELLTILNSRFLAPELMREVMSGTAESFKKCLARTKPCANGNEYLADENVASVKYNAKVMTCYNSEALLNVDFANYDFTKGYAYPFDNYITIKLGKLCLINHIRFYLRSDLPRKYAYRVETSLNGTEYKIAVDHSSHFRSSWQDLHFQSCYVQYIRLFGQTSGSQPIALEVFGLEAMYRTEQPEFIDGVINPSCNVATVEKCAQVVEGAGGNNMLDINSKEFTCHEIGAGSIIVQLNQRYWIDSVGILLGNDQQRSKKYSLYIQTSEDRLAWKMAINKQNEQLSSWQRFTFDSRVALFIRIVGTQRDVNLTCTYFECPSLRETI